MNTSVVTPVDQVLAAAQAALELLPSSGTLTLGSPVGDPAAGAIEGKAVISSFTGAAHGSIAIIVSQDLVDALSETPMGVLDLTLAVRPALEAAASTLGPLVVDPGEVVDPAEALGAVLAEGGRLVPFLAGGDTRAALALAVTARISGNVAAAGGITKPRGLDLLHDVEMEVTAELGRARMTVRKLLELLPGNVVELDRAAGGPADLLVNGRMIARGEVVVIDENFGIRITEIIPQSDRT